MIMTIKEGGMRGKCLLKYRCKLKKKIFVNLHLHVFWTPFSYTKTKEKKKKEKKGEGSSGHESQKIQKIQITIHGY